MGTRRIVGRRIIQMYWTCRFCHKQNHGLEGKEDESLRCLECGGQKADELWEMPSDTKNAPTVTDQEQLGYAEAGSNWTCRFCGNEERSLHEACSVCGAHRYAKKDEPFTSAPPLPPVERVSPPPVTQEEQIASVPSRHLRFGGIDGAMEDVRPPLHHLVGGKELYVLGGTLITAFLLLWLLVWLFATHETNATVTDVYWHRVESVKRRETMSRTGWRGDFPSGSFNMQCEQRQRGTENCHPHACNCHSVSYDCNCTGGDSYSCNCHPEEHCSPNGNGSATCTTTESCSTCTTPRTCSSCSREECDTCYDQCPVYDDWCTGQFYEWVEIDHMEFQGHDLNPQWPGLRPVGDLQRLDRSEDFSTVFADGGDRRWTFHPESERAFRLYPPGARYRVEYNRAGHFRPLRRE